MRTVWVHLPQRRSGLAPVAPEEHLATLRGPANLGRERARGGDERGRHPYDHQQTKREHVSPVLQQTRSAGSPSQAFELIEGEGAREPGTVRFASSHSGMALSARAASGSRFTCIPNDRPGCSVVTCVSCGPARHERRLPHTVNQVLATVGKPRLIRRRSATALAMRETSTCWLRFASADRAARPPRSSPRLRSRTTAAA